jgi:hypothetical protein
MNESSRGLIYGNIEAFAYWAEEKQEKRQEI